MKYLLSTLMMLMFTLSVNAQSAVGIWKTVDDESGEVKSHIKIYEKEGKLFGDVHKLINANTEVCNACKGDKKGQPILGMNILWDLEEESNTEWEGGKIMDPNNGKEYKCLLELTDANTLNVRGYVGFALLGRTQTWFRVVE